MPQTIADIANVPPGYVRRSGLQLVGNIRRSFTDDFQKALVCRSGDAILLNFGVALARKQRIDLINGI